MFRFLPLLLLTGCGSFVLGHVSRPIHMTAEQQQVDSLICKDRAKNEANTDARVAGSFLAGLTIVGAPVAIAAEREKQREVFTKCMTDKGYLVHPA